MTRRQVRGVLLAGLILVSLNPDRAAATWWVEPAVQTCQTFGISRFLAISIILTESGGEPYAIRVNRPFGKAQGKGRGPVLSGVEGMALFPRTYEAAARMAEAAVRITPNVDLGLMQVNYREWGRPLGLTPTQLLHPELNLLVGCAILKLALAEGGPVWQGIGRYHSPYPGRQRAYATKVAAWLKAFLPKSPRKEER